MRTRRSKIGTRLGQRVFGGEGGPFVGKAVLMEPYEGEHLRLALEVLNLARL